MTGETVETVGGAGDPVAGGGELAIKGAPVTLQ